MSGFDAFVSYSHAEDRGVAVRLRTGVEKFAKPWYRLRALRLFLDVSSLSANPGLWSSIEQALSESSWFILVASPRAAGSKWVEREIGWWLQHRSADRLLIVVAEGTLSWDAAAEDFDQASSDALPPALFGVLEQEPRWVTVAPGAERSEPTDVEMRDAVVDVAAAIRGVPREDLEGVAVREHGRTRRWIAGAIAVLSLLLIVAVVAGFVALDQRSSALEQARISLSRQIAAASETAAGDDLNLAMQLAVQAYRTDANPQTRAALMGANISSPNLVRFIDAGARVTSLAGSGDGKTIVATLSDGRVMRWRADDGEGRELFRLPKGRKKIAISRDGSVVVASVRRSECVLWRRGQGVETLPVEPGMLCEAAGISPSGRTVVWGAIAPRYHQEWAAVAPVDDLGDRELHPFSLPFRLDEVVVPSDQSAVLVTLGYWAWKRLSDWTGNQGGVGAGAHTIAHAISADGRLMLVTAGGLSVPIWRTTHPVDDGDAFHPDVSVEVPLPKQTALALSPDGSRVAAAGPGQIYVAPTRADAGAITEAGFERRSASPPVALTGQDPDIVSFASNSRLLSASSREIAVWDTGQLDRLAQSKMVPLEHGCTACPPPSLSISPEGDRVAVVDGFAEHAFVESLDGPARREKLPAAELRYSYGSPLWAADGSFVSFPIWSSPTVAEAPELIGRLPEDIRAWPVSAGEARELVDAVLPGGESAVLVDAEGNAYWRDIETGEAIASAPAPTLAEGEFLDGGAISSSGQFLATSVEDEITVVALPSREIVSKIDPGQYANIAFAGSRLLVQLEDGRLQVWGQGGTTLLRTLSGSGPVWLAATGLAATGDGSLVARSADSGTIALEDLDSGTSLGTLRIPGASVFLKTGVAFSPDGRELVSLSELVKEGSGMLVRREISDQALIRTACAATGAELTPEQWRTFVGTDPPDHLNCD